LLSTSQIANYTTSSEAFYFRLLYHESNQAGTQIIIGKAYYMSEDLNAIMKKIIRFRNERDWRKFHDPKNLSQAIGIEAAELQEIFLWKPNDQSKKLSPTELKSVTEEVADIFIYLIYFCYEFNIDLFKAVEKKIELNSEKHPFDKVKRIRSKYKKL
jgi:NTP pyrophosphatase (non-canonical NTP hydrolase)